MTNSPAHKTLNELAEDFSLFEDWEDRYRYLIDLGRALPEMEPALKTDAALVEGCTSQVWLVAVKGEDGCFHFYVDSDAHIVRGLIAIALAAYQGKSAGEIAQVDIENDFARLGLDQHLSPNRRNGFFAMVERIRALAGTC